MSEDLSKKHVTAKLDGYFKDLEGTSPLDKSRVDEDPVKTAESFTLSSLSDQITTAMQKLLGKEKKEEATPPIRTTIDTKAWREEVQNAYDALIVRDINQVLEWLAQRNGFEPRKYYFQTHGEDKGVYMSGDAYNIPYSVFFVINNHHISAIKRGGSHAQVHYKYQRVERKHLAMELSNELQAAHEKSELLRSLKLQLQKETSNQFRTTKISAVSFTGRALNIKGTVEESESIFNTLEKYLKYTLEQKGKKNTLTDVFTLRMLNDSGIKVASITFNVVSKSDVGFCIEGTNSNLHEKNNKDMFEKVIEKIVQKRDSNFNIENAKTEFENIIWKKIPNQDLGVIISKIQFPNRKNNNIPTFRIYGQASIKDKKQFKTFEMLQKLIRKQEEEQEKSPTPEPFTIRAHYGNDEQLLIENEGIALPFSVSKSILNMFKYDRPQQLQEEEKKNNSMLFIHEQDIEEVQRNFKGKMGTLLKRVISSNGTSIVQIEYIHGKELQSKEDELKYKLQSTAYFDYNSERESEQETIETPKPTKTLVTS